MPNHLCLAWVQSQMAGLHLIVHVGNACRKTSGCVVGGRTLLSSAYTFAELMASDDLKQLRRVQHVQQRSQDAALRDDEQHVLYPG